MSVTAGSLQLEETQQNVSFLSIIPVYKHPVFHIKQQSPNHISIVRYAAGYLNFASHLLKQALDGDL